MARVLVIDDEAGVRQIMAKILERHGHEALEAEDGRAGMALFRQGAIDLVVTDLVMPEQEGIETILQLRSEAPEVPIMAVSGGISVSKTGPLEDALALGADATLEKPFTTEEFMRVVNRLLGAG